MNRSLPSGRNLPKELSRVSVSNITDPRAVSDSFELLEQDVVNLEPENFKVKRVTVPLKDCCLIYHSVNVTLRTRTRIHKDFDACTILGPQSRANLDGVELKPLDLLVTGPGAEGEIIVQSGYESIAWLVPPRVLNQHLELRGPGLGFVIPKHFATYNPPVEFARNHFNLGARIVEAAEATPDIFNDNQWARYGAQVEFLDSLFATIESCEPAEHVDKDKKGISYSRIVKACEDYTSSLEGRRPYLSELCETANVSKRTLQYAFQEILGMSPLTYLNRLRLHWARDELRKAKSGTTTVTEVALDCGFWHFGEFSRAYKNCFGEVPSKTLKQSSIY